MLNLIWNREEFTAIKLGTFCEYYAKMIMTYYGANIYSPDVDDYGIDFIAESQQKFYNFQVKSIREKTHYVFMRADDFNINDDTLYLFLIILKNGQYPNAYIIPASAWKRGDNPALIYRSYEGKKSKPEYGINVSRKNMPFIEDFKINDIINSLL